MSIISQETWNKFTEEEKEKIRKIYEAGKTHHASDTDYCVGFDNGQTFELEQLFGKKNLQSKKLTYEDIQREIGIIEGYEYSAIGKKERAIHQLLLTAKYLNCGWEPDWENISSDNRKWYIFIDGDRNIEYCWDSENQGHIVYFRTEALALQAVEILGEDTIRAAMTTDY